MIFQCSIGDLTSTIETDEHVTPECALDYLNRCADAVHRIFTAIPDDAPTGDEQ